MISIKATKRKETFTELFRDEDNNFILGILSGQLKDGSEWRTLLVKSNNLAKKHEVDIRFNSSSDYSDMRIEHGVRAVTYTLDETVEYIQTLIGALNFGKKIQLWLKTPEANEWRQRNESSNCR